MSVLGMFESLFAEFVSGQVIRLAVGGSGGGVSVSCEIVQFSGSVVGALGHIVLLTCSMRAFRRGIAPCTGISSHAKSPTLQLHGSRDSSTGEKPSVCVLVS